MALPPLTNAKGPGCHRGLAKLRNYSMETYTNLRRLEEAIRTAAARRGISSSNPLAEPPKLGSMNFELRALDIYHDLPARLRVAYSEAAHAMCRAALLSGQVDDHRHCTPMTAPTPGRHPAIARANRAAFASRT